MSTATVLAEDPHAQVLIVLLAKSMLQLRVTAIPQGVNDLFNASVLHFEAVARCMCKPGHRLCFTLK